MLLLLFLVVAFCVGVSLNELGVRGIYAAIIGGVLGLLAVAAAHDIVITGIRVNL